MPLSARPTRSHALLYAAWGLFVLSLALPAVWMPEVVGVPAGYAWGAFCAAVAAWNLPDLLSGSTDSYLGLLTFANALMLSSPLWRRRGYGRLWPAAAYLAATALVAATPFVFDRSANELYGGMSFVWGFYVWLAAFAVGTMHFARAAVGRRMPTRTPAAASTGR
jgi:hypothetical protein